MPHARDHAAAPDILRRRVDFEFDPAVVPERWLGGDLFLSVFMDALSLLFPEGERFFVDSVKRYRDDLRDPVLRRQVLGFCGQEAMHGREHRAFNDMLVGHGMVSAPRREAQLRALLALVRRVLPAPAQLAVTCALEHFTAILAEQFLREETLRTAMDPSVRPLWEWHALEESEHKAVAYDVYQEVSGSYALRVVIMLATTVVFFAKLAHVHVRFLADKGALWRPRAWLTGLAYQWYKPGFFRRLIPAYFAYYRPGFHPNDRDTRALLDAWRARLFGDGGELRPRLRGVWNSAAQEPAAGF